MSEKIRAFVAIDLHNNIKDVFRSVQAVLKSSNADVKWTNPDSLHLTLKFLGNISQEEVVAVKTTLDKISLKFKSFEISLMNIGGFPRLDKPRVIWLGIDKGCSELESLAADLEDAFAGCGFKAEDRRFTAHLTLGRTRSSKGVSDLISKIKSYELKSHAVSPVDKIILYQSTLTPKGPIYTSLHEAMLAGIK